MNSNLTQLEKEILNAILNTNKQNILYEKLYKQYKSLIVKTRTFTNVGFFTEFYMAEDSLRRGEIDCFRLGGIHAKISGLKYGAGFVLFINNGFIATLEGYCYDEEWPKDANIIEIFKVQDNGCLKSIWCQGDGSPVL